jgi:hypothetical protein
MFLECVGEDGMVFTSMNTAGEVEKIKEMIKATFRKCKGGGVTKSYFVSVGEGIR